MGDLCNRKNEFPTALMQTQTVPFCRISHSLIQQQRACHCLVINISEGTALQSVQSTHIPGPERTHVVKRRAAHMKAHMMLHTLQAVVNQ
jgi:hypothetical protein